MNTTTFTIPPKKPSALQRFFQSLARLFGGKKKSKHGDWLAEGTQENVAGKDSATDDFMNMNNVDSNRRG